MVPAPIGGSLLRNTGIFAAVCVTLMLIFVTVSAWRSAGSSAVPFCLPLHVQRIRISQEQEFTRANYLTIAISATGLAMRRSALGGDRYLLRSLVDVFPNIPGGLRDAARARVRREIEAAGGLERAGVDRSALPELRVEDETEFFRSGAIIEVDAATGQLSRVTNEDWDAADPTIFDNNSQLSGSGRLRDELVTRYGGWKVRQLPVAHGGRMQAVATHADGPATGQSLGFDPSAGRIRPFDGDDPATIDGDRIYIQFYEFFDTSPAVTRPLGCLTRCQAVSTMRTRGSFAAIRTPDDKYLLVVSAQQLDELAGREFEISVSVVKIPEPTKGGSEGVVGKESR